MIGKHFASLWKIVTILEVKWSFIGIVLIKKILTFLTFKKTLTFLNEILMKYRLSNHLFIPHVNCLLRIYIV